MFLFGPSWAPASRTRPSSSSGTQGGLLGLAFLRNVPAHGLDSHAEADQIHTAVCELGPPNGSWSSRWEKYSKFSPWSGPFRFIPFLIPDLSHQDNSGCLGWACRSRMCSGVGVLISLLREPNEPQLEAHGNICGRVAGLCGIWFEQTPVSRLDTPRERPRQCPCSNIQLHPWSPEPHFL